MTTGEDVVVITDEAVIATQSLTDTVADITEILMVMAD
jgi:hypothetical protein